MVILEYIVSLVYFFDFFLYFYIEQSEVVSILTLDLPIKYLLRCLLIVRSLDYCPDIYLIFVEIACSPYNICAHFFVLFILSIVLISCVLFRLLLIDVKHFIVDFDFIYFKYKY